MAGRGEALAVLAEMRDERERMLKDRGNALGIIVSELPAPLEGDGWELPAGETCVDVISGQFFDILHTPSGADMFVLSNPARRELTIDMVLEELGDGGGRRGRPQRPIVLRHQHNAVDKVTHGLVADRDIFNGKTVNYEIGRNSLSRVTMTPELRPEGTVTKFYGKGAKGGELQIDGKQRNMLRNVINAVATICEEMGLPTVFTPYQLCTAMGLQHPTKKQQTDAVDMLRLASGITARIAMDKHNRMARSLGAGTVFEGPLIPYVLAEKPGGGTLIEVSSLPLTYRVAKSLRQVIAFPSRYLSLGEGSNTPKNQTLRRIAIERALEVCNGKTGNRDRIRLTRNPKNPGREIEIETAGVNLKDRHARADAEAFLCDVLDGLVEEGVLRRYRVCNEAGRKPKERERHAYILLTPPNVKNG